MRTRFKIRSAVLLPIIVGGVCAVLVKLTSQPQTSIATAPPGKQAVRMQAQPSDPAVSIVFVVDSSPNMFPRFGPNYFDLAKEGIIDFLTLPGFPNRNHFETATTWEISVIQFTELGARGYLRGSTGTESKVHWFGPIHITDTAAWDLAVTLAEKLEPSSHHTASLVDLGIREATALLDASNAAQKHIILLSSGEYRVPKPCPPAQYTAADPGCDSAVECGADDRCNRACHTRYFASEARAHHITVSTMQLGIDWHNTNTSECPEESAPYGKPPNYCMSAPPEQPDRKGLLVELTRSTGMTHLNGTPEACDVGESYIGHFARIDGLYCFRCDAEEHRPGTSRDIARTIADWFCAWNLGGTANEQPGDDGRPPLCDNCPQTANADQRDCDRDGIGDVCRAVYDSTWSQACANTDTDGDGVYPDVDQENCPARDQCPGGDDCLLLPCLTAAEGSEPRECTCDCDHDGQSDACQYARSLCESHDPPTSSCRDDSDGNGYAESCGNNANACAPFPPECRAMELNNAQFQETFDDAVKFPLGPLVGAAPNNHYRGWWVEPGFTAYATIEAGDNGAGQVLAMRDAAGAGAWSLESPGIATPMGECVTTNCADPRFTGWDAFNVDVELWMDNVGANARTYGLEMVDACDETEFASERAHLRFHDGVIERAERPSGDCAAHAPVAFPAFNRHYNGGSWFTIRIAVNTGTGFRNDDDLGCVADGDTRTIRLYYGQCRSVSDPESCSHWYLLDGIRELGCVTAGSSRGVRLRFTSSNAVATAGVLKIGGVRIKKSNRCEWDSANSPCPDGTHCGCGHLTSQGQWACFPGKCGDGQLQPGEPDWEDCDPSMHGVDHCDDSCHWICGDGVLQGDEECDPPSFRFDHFDEWGYPAWYWCTPSCHTVSCWYSGCCYEGYERPCCRPGGPYWCCGWPCICTTVVTCGDGCLDESKARPPFGYCQTNCCGDPGYEGPPCEECERGMPGCNDDCTAKRVGE